MSSDDDFGPPSRGGRGGRRATSVEPLPEKGRRGDQRRPGAPGADGFGPAERGRGPRLPRPRVPVRRDRRERPAREQGRRTRTRRRRPLLRLIVLLLVAVLGFGAALAALASLRMDRVDVDGLSSAGWARMNVLVAGDDTREGFTDEELEQIGTTRVDGGRPDTIFLLSTDGVSAAMLAFPRDLYVTRCDGSQGRINAAPAIDGPSCLVQTVSELSGLPVTHYMEVDLAGFVDLVDAVGGVTMTLDEPIVDRAAGADLPAGEQRMDGRDALSYVRVRGIDDDLGRIERQQQFLQALSREIASPTTLLNPVRLWNTTDAGASALTADRGLGPFDLARLGVGVGAAGSGMPTYTVPANPQSVGGAAVLVPDEGRARQLFDRFADGSALREVPDDDAS